jgi:hypothetical protein
MFASQQVHRSLPLLQSFLCFPGNAPRTCGGGMAWHGMNLLHEPAVDLQ